MLNSLVDQPGKLVLEDLNSIYQVVFTSHPNWHEIDELGQEDAICNHLPGLKTCCLADLPYCPNPLFKTFEQRALVVQNVFSPAHIMERTHFGSVNHFRLNDL